MYDIYPQFELSSIIAGLDFRILFIIYLLNRMLMKHSNSFFYISIHLELFQHPFFKHICHLNIFKLSLYLKQFY